MMTNTTYEQDKISASDFLNAVMTMPFWKYLGHAGQYVSLVYGITSVMQYAKQNDANLFAGIAAGASGYLFGQFLIDTQKLASAKHADKLAELDAKPSPLDKIAGEESEVKVK